MIAIAYLSRLFIQFESPTLKLCFSVHNHGPFVIELCHKFTAGIDQLIYTVLANRSWWHWLWIEMQLLCCSITDGATTA